MSENIHTFSMMTFERVGVSSASVGGKGDGSTIVVVVIIVAIVIVTCYAHIRINILDQICTTKGHPHRSICRHRNCILQCLVRYQTPSLIKPSYRL